MSTDDEKRPAMNAAMTAVKNKLIQVQVQLVKVIAERDILRDKYETLFNEYHKTRVVSLCPQCSEDGKQPSGAV